MFLLPSSYVSYMTSFLSSVVFLYIMHVFSIYVLAKLTFRLCALLQSHFLKILPCGNLTFQICGSCLFYPFINLMLHKSRDGLHNVRAKNYTDKLSVLTFHYYVVFWFAVFPNARCCDKGKSSAKTREWGERPRPGEYSHGNQGKGWPETCQQSEPTSGSCPGVHTVEYHELTKNCSLLDINHSGCFNQHCYMSVYPCTCICAIRS